MIRAKSRNCTRASLRPQFVCVMKKLLKIVEHPQLVGPVTEVEDVQKRPLSRRNVHRIAVLTLGV